MTAALYGLRFLNRPGAAEQMIENRQQLIDGMFERLTAEEKETFLAIIAKLAQ